MIIMKRVYNNDSTSYDERTMDLMLLLFYKYPVRYDYFKNKYGISKSTFKRMIQSLRNLTEEYDDMNIWIYYDKKRRCYRMMFY